MFDDELDLRNGYRQFLQDKKDDKKVLQEKSQNKQIPSEDNVAHKHAFESSICVPKTNAQRKIDSKVNKYQSLIEKSIDSFESLRKEKNQKELMEKNAKSQITPSIHRISEIQEVIEEENEEGFKVRICYEAQRRWLNPIPKTLLDLRDTIISLFHSSKNKPLTDEDFRMYFYDFDGEKCIIDTDLDLQTAYCLAKKAIPNILKLCIDIRRGLNVCDSDSDNRTIRIKTDYNDRRYNEESDDEEDYEKWKLDNFELEFNYIMRDGFPYQRYYPYNKANYASLSCWYACRDNHINGCSGRWETYPLMFNGEFGKMIVPHSIPKEKHTTENINPTIEKYAKALLTGTGVKDEILSKDEVLALAKAMSRNDCTLTSTQLVASIKQCFPNANLPTRRIFQSIVSSEKMREIKYDDNGTQIFRMDGIRTLRKTQFGRGMTFTLVEGKPKYYIYFYSDFQWQVAEEMKDDPNFHLFVDGTFKCCPKVWSQLLNVCVFHKRKKLYIPICHVLMQTQTYEGYVSVFHWLRDTFGFNPKFVTVDFEIATMRVIKEVWPDCRLVPCFFHFVKCLWMNAAKCGLRKKKFVCDTKQLVFSLKALAFRPPAKVYRRFEKIKGIYEQKGNCYKSFLEYFETTWMDGTFKINDWNYYEKINDFEDLAITNNGLESFHQIIKSQLRRITPSFKGFIEVLARAETLKKSDYDEDRINGDPQYNRCWPVTKIMRELYCKESSQEKKMKDLKDGVEEEISQYVPKDLSSLKNSNVGQFNMKTRKVEREVMFLFEEFDENKISLQQDKVIRERAKLRKEIRSTSGDPQNASGEPFEVIEKYLTEDKPKLDKAIVGFKVANSDFIRKKPKQEKTESQLLKDRIEEDMDEELEQILNGDLVFQTYATAFDPNKIKRRKK
ncbi:unnamed protein product [Moneuplotes crassus]|uniref:MULE transposase domain-containing protein n=1 Tax=Euplotes crassus TaxID=5936 RepID=A0AAD2D7P4_EUPCR|nr:unnamed protein product [Moneuplotes crassus]